MSNGTTADFAGLQNASTVVRNTNDTVQGLLDSLESAIASDLAPAWQGAAATSFANLMAEYNTQQGNLSTALLAIADMLDANNATYTATEELEQTNYQHLFDELGAG